MQDDGRNEKRSCKKAEKKKAEENALNMLKDNVSIEKVVQYSGLSLEEVEKLNKEKNN